MATIAQPPDPKVMSEMNTTPLIDVLLVLLIMFIMTIPLQTHSVKLDLPTAKPLPFKISDVKNKVVVTAADQILWNGTRMTSVQLRHALDATTQMRPVPELQVEPESEARYAVVDQVLAITKQAQVENVGFVGNERYARF